MCSNIRTPNNHYFLFGTNGKVVVLGVPILKHFRVYPRHTKYVEGYIVFVFPSVRLSIRASKFCTKFFLHIKKWRWPGVSMLDWALALVYIIVIILESGKSFLLNSCIH